jgi:hypothetical protein
MMALVQRHGPAGLAFEAMWLAMIAVAAGSGLGMAAGGRLANLRSAGLRWLGLLGAGAVCEGVADRWLEGDAGLGLVVAGYVLMLGFALLNLPHPGSVLVAAGLLANLLVVAVNGGMPVRGVTPGAQLAGHHHGETPGDHLTGLADVMYVAPLGETLSAGDVLVASGVGIVVGFAVGGRRVVRERRQALIRNGAGNEANAGASM